MYNNKRSPQKLLLKEQRKAARRLIQTTAYKDYIHAESICRITTDEIAYHLAILYGEPNPDAVPAVEKGLVLNDSVGRGFFQLT